jgi:hypothetical protein
MDFKLEVSSSNDANRRLLKAALTPREKTHRYDNRRQSCQSNLLAHKPEPATWQTA